MEYVYVYIYICVCVSECRLWHGIDCLLYADVQLRFVGQFHQKIVRICKFMWTPRLKDEEYHSQGSATAQRNASGEPSSQFPEEQVRRHQQPHKAKAHEGRVAAQEHGPASKECSSHGEVRGA